MEFHYSCERTQRNGVCTYIPRPGFEATVPVMKSAEILAMFV
jgi:hypothetical protein